MRFGIAIFLLSTNVWAGQLFLDMRFDADSVTFNEDANKNASGNNWGVSNFTRTYIQTGRLDYMGAFNDKLTFRTRLRFAGKNMTDLTFKDYTGSVVDFAYVEHRWCESFSLRAGKMLGDMGGFDRLTPSPDTYFTSREYNDLQTNGALYETGLRFMFTLSGQDLNVFVGSTFGTTDKGVTKATTGTADTGGSVTGATNTSGFDQAHLAYGMVYEGSFLDKTLRPILSYHVNSPQDVKTPEANRQDTYSTVGVRYDMKTYYGRLDYDMYKYQDKTANGTTDNTKDIVGEIGYNVAEKHWVKITGESAGVTTTNVTTIWTTYGAAYEYHPFNDNTFRYHVAYTNSTASIPANAATNPNTSPSRTDIYAGIRIYADILK